jgi:hypothetical protein
MTSTRAEFWEGASTEENSGERGLLSVRYWGHDSAEMRTPLFCREARMTRFLSVFCILFPLSLAAQQAGPIDVKVPVIHGKDRMQSLNAAKLTLDDSARRAAISVRRHLVGEHAFRFHKHILVGISVSLEPSRLG